MSEINLVLRYKGRFGYNDEGVLEYLDGEECY